MRRNPKTIGPRKKIVLVCGLLRRRTRWTRRRRNFFFSIGLPGKKKMPTITRMFTMQEASQHTSKDDCWIVVDGKVYDVSSYLDEHPGGDDVVLAATGKDATDEFEDAGHSREARELLETFCIGELDKSSSPAIPGLDIVSKKLSPDYAQKLVDLSKQYWAVPVAVIGISMVVGFLVLRKK